MLKDIIKSLGAELGLDPSNSANRSLLINKINEGAKSLYNSGDLAYSFRVKPFNFTGEDSLIYTLPSYVGSIRGMRNAAFDHKIDIKAIPMRFHHSNYGEAWPLSFTEFIPGPQITDILNAGPLTVSIESAQSSSFTVAIVGSTPFSDRVVETLIFAPGDLTKTTTFNFEDGLIAINKSAQTTVDVQIHDTSSTLISVIPAKKLEASFKRVMVGEYNQSPEYSNDQNYIEVLFKYALDTLEDDYDSFLGINIWDDVIVLMVLADYYTKSQNKEALEAVSSRLQGKKVDIQREFEKSFQKKIDYGENVYYKALRSGMQITD